MKFRIRFAQQVVGVFVMIALVFGVVVLVAMGANQRWFARNYEYYSIFPTGEGLSVGMAVRFKGFSIGRVTEVTLAEEDQVRVAFYVEDTYIDRVLPNSVMQLVTSPIGIGGGLVFHQGIGTGEPLEEFSLIPSINSPEGQRIVADGLASVPSTGDDITRIIAQVEPLLVSVNTLLTSVDGTVNHINRALAGDTSEPLGLTLAQINALLEEVEATLVAARDEALATLASVAVIAGNFEATSAELRDPTGLVPRLLDADGSITTFLNDNNALYNEVEAMLRSINATLDEVNDLAIFVNSTQPQIAGILEESREAIILGQDVLEGVSNAPIIRRGITPEAPQPSTFQSHRDAQF